MRPLIDRIALRRVAQLDSDMEYGGSLQALVVAVGNFSLNRHDLTSLSPTTARYRSLEVYCCLQRPAKPPSLQWVDSSASDLIDRVERQSHCVLLRVWHLQTECLLLTEEHDNDDGFAWDVAGTSFSCACVTVCLYDLLAVRCSFCSRSCVCTQGSQRR